MGNLDSALGSTMSGFVKVGDGGVRGFMKRVSVCCVRREKRFGVAISVPLTHSRCARLSGVLARLLMARLAPCQA